MLTGLLPPQMRLAWCYGHECKGSSNGTDVMDQCKAPLDYIFFNPFCWEKRSERGRPFYAFLNHGRIGK